MIFDPANYAFPLRTLRRWRDERLALHDEPGGGVRAEFRFEGSTCGNIPFHLRYAVRLGPASEGHPVLECRCAPAPLDDGHQRMCSFLEDPGRLLDTLQSDQPWCGRTIDAALKWQPVVSPAGCVCSAGNRAHKWRAVLQTLHFALCERAAAEVSPSL